MKVGEKIRKARLDKKITQAKLCGEKITRNMLSAIENGKANPSIDTLAYLSERLSLPLPYLISEEDNAFFYKKESQIAFIRNAMRVKKYKVAIDALENLGGTDDECELILAQAYFELGKRSVLSGSLTSGKTYLSKSVYHAGQTVYSTLYIEHQSLLYSALAANITAPLLELDVKAFEASASSIADMDLYKYVSMDKEYNYANGAFKKHLSAKEYIKSRDYYGALEILKRIEAEKNSENYNSYFVLSLYADLELCYKQLGDFENAYRYSTKRMSIIDGFKS